MRKRFVSLISSLLLSMGLLLALPSSGQAATWSVPTPGQSAPDASSLTLSLDDFETAVLVTINGERISHGLWPIALFDSCTDRMAERWGRRIATTGAFGHRDQRQILRRCGTSWAGEALVRGTQLTAQTMVQLWMDSPPHREILLSPHAMRGGVAVVPDAEGRLVGVLNLTHP